MNGPFKLKGWSPFTQKPTGRKIKPGYNYPTGPGNPPPASGPPASKERQAYDIKMSKILEKIAEIQEEASTTGELTDTQKNNIALLEEQATELRKTKPKSN